MRNYYGRISTVLGSLLMVTMLALFSSCGFSAVGTIPSGTPDHGNGTPAVIPTTLNPSSLQTAPATAVGSVYAFVRKNQLWMTTNDTNPLQVTHFVYTNLPDIFWHQPLWSPNDHFIAFMLAARPAGQGGGGCPAPDYGANGALYILNAATHQLTSVSLLSSASNAANNAPRNDFWQSMFWEDPTHLLAWYNGVTGNTGNGAGLYRYDLTAGTLTQVIPLSSLGSATLFHAQPNMPLLLSIRYGNGQLFYQVVIHPFEQQSQVVIYSHSVAHPEQVSSKVLVIGNVPWCVLQLPGPFVKPGWDISPDGEQIVAQMVTSDDGTRGIGSVAVLNLRDGVATALFTNAPAQWLGHDLTLTWGPDSQTVIASASRIAEQVGPYSATLANPAAIQQYTPSIAGQIVWRADSSAFALESLDSGDTVSNPNIYLFIPGKAQGQLLLTDVQKFVWG